MQKVTTQSHSNNSFTTNTQLTDRLLLGENKFENKFFKLLTQIFS